MKRFLSVLASLVLLNGLIMPLALTHATASNLISNPSVETANGSEPANWTPDNWGTNTTSMTYKDGGHTGNKSLYIDMRAHTNGDAKWIPDSSTITSSQSYTYSEYYISNVATELDAEYTDGNGNVSYIYLTNVAASSSWNQAMVTFTTPANAVKVSVLNILDSVGTLQTDDFSLSQSIVVTPPPNTDDNLIVNPSMETSSGSNPTDWQIGGWGTNTSAFTYNTNGGYTGNHSLTVQTTSYTNGDAKWYFNPVSVQPNTQYTYSDYYKSTIASSLVAEYDDGNGNLTYVNLSSPNASANWQRASVTFTTPATAKYITIFHLIAGVGTLQIDDASLILSTAPTDSVNITAPTAGTSVNGTITITANAVSSQVIKSVQFVLDGNKLGNAVATSPYKQTWNTSNSLNGTHSLTAIETLNDGSKITSATVQVSVNNQVPSGGNLIANPSMEIPDPSNSKAPLGWTGSSWGTNTSVFTYLKTGHTGTRSVKAQVTNYTNGAAYWYFDNAPVTGGQMYDFTDYYESNIDNEIDATVTMSDGSVQYLYIGEAFPSPKSWTKFEAQFTAPVGAVSITMQHNIFAVGWLTTDDYSLTPFSYQGFNRPIISITDDDSYASFYNNGLPLLQKYGFNSTDYIITGYVNNVAGYMSSAMVKGLYAAGNEIGSHTIDHPDLTTLTAAKADSELKNSQIYLQNLLGIPITDYAAPYGATNTQVVNDAKQYYKTYRGVEPGYNAKNNFDPYNIQVQNIIDTTTLADVQSWITEAQSTNTWLVLVYHQVDPNSSAGEYNTYPSDFDAQLAAIKASGITVETVSQALTEINSQL